MACRCHQLFIDAIDYSSISYCLPIDNSLAVFILEDALSVWTNLGKHLLLDALCVSSIKTGTRRIMRLDELPMNDAQQKIVRLDELPMNDAQQKIVRLDG